MNGTKEEMDDWLTGVDATVIMMGRRYPKDGGLEIGARWV